MIKNEKSLASLLDKSAAIISAFGSHIGNKIKRLEKGVPKNGKSKRKAKHYDNSLTFYNSLSLIMLSLLAGGLVGVIFILYYSFKSSDKQDLTY